MKLPKEIWMCENEQAKWFEFEQPHDLPNDVVITKMIAQRTWVGLTDDEIEKTHQQYGGNIKKMMRAIEAKLKEKNT